MKKNKTIMRLVSHIVFASILTTLPASLPLDGQPLPGATTQQTMQQERLKKEVEQKIEHIRSTNWRLKAVQIAIPSIKIVGLFIPLGLLPIIPLWATGQIAIIAKMVFKISAQSVAKAFDNAKELEQLEKDNIIKLSTEKKAVIKKLRKRQKSLIIQGIIKNLRLNDIRTKLVNAAILDNSSFVKQLTTKKKMNEKAIRKLFDGYIKARWEKKSQQKQAYRISTLLSTKKESKEKNALKKLQASNAKRLGKMKKKTENIESQYPRLKTALKKAVDTYTDEANKMLQELEKVVTKALKKRK